MEVGTQQRTGFAAGTCNGYNEAKGECARTCTQLAKTVSDATKAHTEAGEREIQPAAYMRRSLRRQQDEQLGEIPFPFLPPS